MGLEESWGPQKVLKYIFLFVRCNISERVGLVQAMMWQAHIHRMLHRIPSIYSWDLVAFLNPIESKLSAYENLENAFTLLELAIWKSKITEQFSGRNILLTTEINMQCLTEFATMVNVIVPNVMSFSTDFDNWGDEEEDDEEEDDDGWNDEDDDDQGDEDDGN